LFCVLLLFFLPHSHTFFFYHSLLPRIFFTTGRRCPRAPFPRANRSLGRGSVNQNQSPRSKPIAPPRRTQKGPKISFFLIRIRSVAEQRQGSDVMHDGRAGGRVHASCIIHARLSPALLPCPRQRRNPVLVPGVRVALWPVEVTSQKAEGFEKMKVRRCCANRTFPRCGRSGSELWLKFNAVR
jgi:hypothetical protein